MKMNNQIINGRKLEATTSNIYYLWLEIVRFIAVCCGEKVKANKQI
jgi:hypothetical protein